MSSDPPKVQVRFTDDFLRQVRALAKRYRQIQADISNLASYSRRRILGVSKFALPALS